MKIRNGFVSNSSSSSFCLFGSPIEIEDLILKVFGHLGEKVRGCDCQPEIPLKDYPLTTNIKFCPFCGKKIWIEQMYNIEDAIEKFNYEDDKSLDNTIQAYYYSQPYIGFDIDGLSAQSLREKLKCADEIKQITGKTPLIHCGEYAT